MLGMGRMTVVMAALIAVGGATGNVGTAAARPAKFCVLTGGPRGPGSLPAICRFFDYQQCLQAAADLRGNCVINVDYPGKITGAPGAAWSRQ
jgi:hypothetical protein